MIKTFINIGIDRVYLNIINPIYNKPTANMIFNGEKLKSFSLKSGTRQGYPFLTLPFNIMSKVVATANNNKK